MKTDVTNGGSHNGATKISEIRKLVKIFHEQLNKLILNVAISSDIDEVEKNDKTSESIS